MLTSPVPLRAHEAQLGRHDHRDLVREGAQQVGGN
jgi:hypothetical protein